LEFGTPKLEFGTPKLEFGTPKLEFGTPKLEFGTAAATSGAGPVAPGDAARVFDQPSIDVGPLATGSHFSTSNASGSWLNSIVVRALAGPRRRSRART